MDALNIPKKANHLFIGLDKEVFHPGSPVSGILVVHIDNLETLKHAKSIGLHWEGGEFVSWYEGIAQNYHCTDTRKFLSSSQTLWTATDGPALKEGTTTLRFSYDLPSRLPTSYYDPAQGNLYSIVPNWVLPSDIIPRSLAGTFFNKLYYHCLF